MSELFFNIRLQWSLQLIHMRNFCTSSRVLPYRAKSWERL